MIGYDDLAAFLLEAIPEKSAYIESLLDEMGQGRSNYLLVSMLRDDLVDNQSQHGRWDERYVRAFFVAMEKLAELGDQQVRDCIAIEIVESLYADDARNLPFPDYYGPQLRRMQQDFKANTR